jgi:hypothetical protein
MPWSEHQQANLCSRVRAHRVGRAFRSVTQAGSDIACRACGTVRAGLTRGPRPARGTGRTRSTSLAGRTRGAGLTGSPGFAGRTAPVAPV